MESDSERKDLAQEIQRRMMNLINTDNVSDEEKLIIARKAIEILEKAKKGAVQ